MKKIHWRPLNDCLYWVSSDGRVRTFKRRKRILMPAIDKGYYKVGLWDNDLKKEYSRWVHRLVAFAFCRKRPGMNEVNHIDANKLNNNYWNLEIKDHTHNIQHCDLLGLREFRSGQDHGMAKFTNDDIKKIRSLYATGKTSFPKLSRQFGTSLSNVQRIVARQTWKNI